MKKKTILRVLPLMVIALIWFFVSCSSGDKTTETPKPEAEKPKLEEKTKTQVNSTAGAQPCATTITILFKAEGDPNYIKDVTDLIIGNMVDPVTGVFWYQPPPGNPWVWNNDGTNCVKFGLMGNYKYKMQEATALSKVVIDPTKMTPGAHEVVAMLKTCKRGPGNILLRFVSATLDGKEAPDIVNVNDWGTQKPQPTCPYCQDCGLNPQK